MTTQILDLIIIGGGPAGQSAALIAGRTRLKTALINAENPRNLVTTASHGFLTRDGVHPSELLKIAKSQLQKYPSVNYIADSVLEVTKVDSGFSVTTGEGKNLSCKRLLIATGYKDDLNQLAMPGIEDVYGKSVYPCPFCDGFEHADEPMAIFGYESLAHFVPMMRIWSNDLIVFTNGKLLEPELKKSFERQGIKVEQDFIEQLHSKSGKLMSVQLKSGHCVLRSSGFVIEDFSKPVTQFAQTLGVKAQSNNEWGMSELATASGTTNVNGLYVVGDARTGFSGIAASVSEGAFCVEMIVHDIAMQNWKETQEKV